MNWDELVEQFYSRKKNMEFLNSVLFKKLKVMKSEKEGLALEVEALSEKKSELETSIDTLDSKFGYLKDSASKKLGFSQMSDINVSPGRDTIDEFVEIEKKHKEDLT
eukprot:CAMPEP_0114575462 /NCGR_PEP_ID=MMETSP0125-20121206/326_1 /TAXON_ID=485358 ORGANISM="Aristerostoma sp., Strain ATCC 50986" /NCGR_SAMPLE_ID=MMETSP0125 /ASSEMBLY_ACC=CAM_ASM_000245 /LENGTH=106 /DNA_ID=CAMNT_0001763205 /DNA_START=1065 /DNA_END=1385 /DNA_ORIENTATION=+